MRICREVGRPLLLILRHKGCSRFPIEVRLLHVTLWLLNEISFWVHLVEFRNVTLWFDALWYSVSDGNLNVQISVTWVILFLNWKCTALYVTYKRWNSLMGNDVHGKWEVWVRFPLSPQILTFKCSYLEPNNNSSTEFNSI